MNKHINEMNDEDKVVLFNSFFRGELLYMDENYSWKRCTEMTQNQRTIYKVDITSKYDEFIGKKSGDVVFHNGILLNVLKESDDIHCNVCYFNSEDLSLCPLVRDPNFDLVTLACEKSSESVVYCAFSKLGSPK